MGAPVSRCPALGRLSSTTAFWADGALTLASFAAIDPSGVKQLARPLSLLFSFFFFFRGGLNAAMCCLLHSPAQTPHHPEHRHRWRRRAIPPLVEAPCAGACGVLGWLVAVQPVMLLDTGHFWALALLLAEGGFTASGGAFRCFAW